jgi:hypothetical protein
MAWRRWGSSRDDRVRAWLAGDGIDDGRRRPEPWVVAAVHQGRACASRERQGVLGFGGGGGDDRAARGANRGRRWLGATAAAW